MQACRVRAAVQRLGLQEEKRVCSGAGVCLLLLQLSGIPRGATQSGEADLRLAPS